MRKEIKYSIEFINKAFLVYLLINLYFFMKKDHWGKGVNTSQKTAKATLVVISTHHDRRHFFLRINDNSVTDL